MRIGERNCPQATSKSPVRNKICISHHSNDAVKQHCLIIVLTDRIGGALLEEALGGRPRHNSVDRQGIVVVMDRIAALTPSAHVVLAAGRRRLPPLLHLLDLRALLLLVARHGGEVRLAHADGAARRHNARIVLILHVR